MLKHLAKTIFSCYIAKNQQRLLKALKLNGTVKRLRERKALSQRDLAIKAGLSLATVNRVERGLHKPSPKTVRKLAKALETKPEALLSRQLLLE